MSEQEILLQIARDVSACIVKLEEHDKRFDRTDTKLSTLTEKVEKGVTGLFFGVLLAFGALVSSPQKVCAYLLNLIGKNN